MARWWDKYFYSKYEKPAFASDGEFERVYLQRKRFLFENFGEFGIGEEQPVKDGKFVNVIMKWCVDFIPYLLGVKLTCLEEGFWLADPLTEDEIKKLKPVDIAKQPFSEWILGRKNTLEKRYGKAEIGQLVEGSVNAAYRVRGELFYYDLIMNKSLAKHLLYVITETVIMTYKFFAREFDLQEIFLANCTNIHIGPELYEEMALQNDIRVTSETRALFKKDRFTYLHNCDSSADKFIDLYKKIPGVYKIDGADNTDIKRMKAAMPDVKFAAYLNPKLLMQLSASQFKERIYKDMTNGCDELMIANIDTLTDVNDVNTVFKSIVDSCKELDYNPVFSTVPFTEDEYEWAFPTYQGNGPYHCKDDWNRLIPKP